MPTKNLVNLQWLLTAEWAKSCSELIIGATNDKFQFGSDSQAFACFISTCTFVFWYYDLICNMKKKSFRIHNKLLKYNEPKKL